MASELVESVRGAPHHEDKLLGLQSAGKGVFLHARDLDITWVEDPRYWEWISIKHDDKVVEAAKLLQVWWLEVKGKYDMTKLKTGATYHVVFEVMMQEASLGWDAPVTLEIVLPRGHVISHDKRLNTLPPDNWADLNVGHFTVPPDAGNIMISLTEIKKKKEKNGLIIRAIRIEEV